MTQPAASATLGGRDFLRLWSAQSVSSFGSMFGALGFTALVYLKATPSQMGLLAAAEGLPVLLFALHAGALIDRVARKPVLLVSDLGRFFALLTVPICAVLGALSMPQLYLVGFVCGLLELTFRVAYRALLPELVPRSQLVAANARLTATESVGEVASPAAGGIIVQAAGAPLAVLIDALTFLFSAASIAGIRRKLAIDASTMRSRSLLAEAGEGIGAVWESPILRAMTLGRASSSFFGGFIGALYGVFLIQTLGFSPLVMGMTIGAGGLGSIGGALLAGTLTRRIGVGPTLLLSGGRVFVCLLPLASGPNALSLGLILAAQLLGDPFWTIGEISSTSLQQAVTPARMLGRVSSATHLLEAGLAPAGALSAGLLAEVAGVREMLAIGAAGVSLSFLWLVFSPIPRLRSLEPSQDDPPASGT